MTDQIRCWIVGPYELFNQALISLFDRFPGIISIGQTAKDIFWDDVPNDQPIDVIIFNLYDFTDLEHILAEKTSHTLAWIAHDWTMDYVRKALELGISGCIDAKSPEDEFLSIIRQAAKGDVAISSKLAVNLYINLAEEERDKEKIRFDELTSREQEVLELLCKGLSNKQIAQHMFLSVRTVHNHLANIYNKLNVNSRTEAAVFAIKNGWITIEY